MIRNDATEAQVIAARPDASTWLSANAGSGKTRVLTDRVARLLLSGVAPENILCLTYTKAAASEMQNRLFKRLGEWAMLDNASLGAALADLGEDGPFRADFLQRARTLFARAIETPGGLRIQTIHSFCASLLRRFPLEAQVSPEFREVEDRAAELLRADMLDRMAEGPDGARIADLAGHFTDSDDRIDALMKAMLARKTAFLPPRDPDAIRALYGLPAGFGPDDLLAEIFLGSEGDLVTELIPLLDAGGKLDQEAADCLRAFDGPTDAGRKALMAAFFTQAGTPKTRVPRKGLKTDPAHAQAMTALEQLMARLEDAQDRARALMAAERDLALHRFAQVFLPAYEAEKTARGWLDFDDLIEKAHGLLSDEAVAQWVLYRLDGGIDHILVDEAQDTNPLQWEVIALLAQEADRRSGGPSGRGAHDLCRGRQEAVDLFLPGRRSRRLRPDARQFRRKAQGGRDAASGPLARLFLPLYRGDPDGGGCHLRGIGRLWLRTRGSASGVSRRHVRSGRSLARGAQARETRGG